MDNEGILKAGSESQDSDEPAPPGISKADFKQSNISIKPLVPKPVTTTVGFKLTPSPKGVENAKKRLRAFSIQKKTPITPVTVTKGLGGGSTTVFIGKLSNVKVTPKPEDVDQKKPPKPPKPGQARKVLQDSYTELQKRTLVEIEDMKRKMELVELGIPLGLICPSATNDKAMPTKAMPPIKTFLDPAKLDEVIGEAKKAKAEGREFKFDYQRLLPDYDNPFQRKRDELERVRIVSEERDRDLRKKVDKEREKDRRRSDKYEKDSRRYSSHRKDEKDKRKDDRDKYRDKSKEKTEDRKDESKDRELTPVAKKKVEKVGDKETKETDVNLSDYLVCDSWSLDNDDKSNASPKIDDRIKNIPIPKESKPKEPYIEVKKEKIDSPLTKPTKKIQKLQPVIDSFKFEIDPNDDELLDMFDENSDLEKFATKTRKREDIFDSPIDMKIFDFDQNTKESADALTDDTFLESVINEIKQEDMSEDDGSQDKGLVEYDSPSKESQSPPLDSRLSVTPELDDRMRGLQSSRSDYSDGYRSTESGYKSTESGYKSSASYKSGDSKGDSYRMSMEKELEGQLNKSTVDSLETWSFVLKICQPLLFRHDRNKCYRETRTSPKIWYTENPKLCSCVKDRAIVYDELETCKMNLVDRVYGCDQIPEVDLPKTRTWYPRFAHCLTESNAMPSLVPSCDWEGDDSQTETPNLRDKRRSSTPQRSEEIYLDREYQRFMQAVWPEVSESKAGTPRSTTPVRQESRKKKAEDKDSEYKKKSKKIKLSSEGWSQESDVEEEVDKTKKIKAEKVKVRKRKHSTSSVSESEESAKKRKKALKKAKSEELFDVNILNNIKTERLTDEEKNQKLVDFSPRRQKPREIINVKELQNDFVGNNIHIKQEVEDSVSKEGVKMMEFELEEKEFATEREPEVPEVRDVPDGVEQEFEEKEREEINDISFKEIPLPALSRPDHTDTEQISVHKPDDTTLSTQVDKEPQDINIPLPQASLPEESNLSQCSSQESSASKDVPYEKDDSHLRPSSQNSNYSFNDVISASQSYQKDEDKFQEYEGNYEMYEQLAMAYQSDVAKQAVPVSASEQRDPQRIETVVRARSRGEIKCDWRAADAAAPPAPPPNHRPSRWGLKPGEVNIVLTGGDEYPPRPAEPVYQIQTIANRSENNSAGYDEAYEDMYGASDRLQYGDCFNTDVEPEPAEEPDQPAHSSSLDDRINLALRTTVLGEVSKDTDEVDGDKDGPEKGILVNKAVPESRGAKRVSFADGYKPGQDSDVEEPPVKKKKKQRRFGCAWPCPATHADHVPLWDALPPPPPPPGSPPPNIHLAIKAQMMMMQQAPNMMQQPPNMMQQPPNMMQSAPNMMQPTPNMMQPTPNMMQQAPNMMQQPPMLPQQQMLQQQGVKSMMPNTPFSMPQKLDPSVSLPNFLPPEPPPGLLTFP
uniref:Uncharacterized protein n=1 Tax=Heliothis virescens TaxID=7102 RepID=A0A2A4JJY3_HELVI